MKLVNTFLFLISSIGTSQARIPSRALDGEEGSTQYTYFVQARGIWTALDTKAVQEANGQIFLRHEATGMALVTSSDPEFVNNAKHSFTFVAEDLAVDLGLEEGVHEQSVTPEDDSYYPLQWNMLAIDAPGAWGAGCDGAGARVAVIDGGISHEHVDIAPNLDTQCSFSTVEGFQYFEDSSLFRHSTHVAGIIAAADNEIGTIGVAPSSTIMAVKALHGGSGSFGAIIMAILFSADPQSFGTGCTEKADIINMSLGAIGRKRHLQGFHHYITKAVNFAASKGVLVISAAGNDGADLGQAQDWLSFPGTSGSGIAVSATGPVGFPAANNFRNIASYTNYGESLIDIAGPGGDYQNYPNEGWYLDMVLSPGYGTGFYSFSAGTSMAAPAVAGVAALIKAANPNISVGALKTKLLTSADDEGKVGNDEFYGHGFVNAYRACVK